MTKLECNLLELVIFTLCKHATRPPNQCSRPTIWLVYVAKNLNNSLKCHIFVPHISTYIYCRIVNQIYSITRKRLERLNSTERRCNVVATSSKRHNDCRAQKTVKEIDENLASNDDNKQIAELLL